MSVSIIADCDLFSLSTHWDVLTKQGRLLVSRTCQVLFLGWIGDMLYMNKTFDEAMAKRGFANTSVRNEQGR